MLDREEFKNRIGQKIREVRESKGISQKDFEFLEFGIERQMLSKIERGLRYPELYTLYRIAKTLNVSLSELLKGVDND